MNPGFTKSYTAGGTIAYGRLVKFSADRTVVQAAAATDFIIGVCTQPGGATSGQRVDVAHGGMPEVEFGGTVNRGDFVTSDADGKAVASAPSAGVNNRVAGFPVATQASGDIAPLVLDFGFKQG